MIRNPSDVSYSPRSQFTPVDSFTGAVFTGLRQDRGLILTPYEDFEVVRMYRGGH